MSRSFRFKLTVLLVLSAAIPVLFVTTILLTTSQAELLQHLKNSLQLNLNILANEVTQLEQVSQQAAIDLAAEIEDFNLSDQDGAIDPAVLDSILDRQKQFSFVLFTNRQGSTIAQNIQILEDFHARLPTENNTQQPRYQRVPTAIGINLSDVPIVAAASTYQRSFVGAELLSHSVLQRLGLAEQASIGIRAQPTQGLIPTKQPSSEGTYDIEHGKIGLVVMAVQPIISKTPISKTQAVGTVIVGTLLNRNFEIVDRVKHTFDVPTVTIFAQDWRVSTNVPYIDHQTRAIGTRVAQEVAAHVLDQEQEFIGQTNIVGTNYLTRYRPLYDHRKQFSQQTKPIGILFVGQPQTSIHQLLQHQQLISYSVGSFFLVFAGMSAVPIAASFSQPLKRLARSARRVVVEAEAPAQHSVSQSELSLLAQELHDVAVFDRANGRTNNEIQVLAATLSKLIQQIINYTEALELARQTLEQRVNDRTWELSQKNQQLQQAHDQLSQAMRELQNTQTQLIQTEKMSSLGQLVAGIAHEINNPINFIYGNVLHATQNVEDLLKLLKLYQQFYPDPPAAIQAEAEFIDLDFLLKDLPNLLSSMQVGTDRIREIVLALRNFSRVDEAEMKTVDIHTGIDSTLMILQNRLKDNPEHDGIEVIKQYGDLPLVECYAGQLNQVFMNILVNAIDAIDEINAQRQPTCQQPSQIAIQTEATDQHVRIWIRDTGPGISESTRQRLFEPFFTTKPIGKGTGLGLSISYQVVVERHRGKLSCVSAPGQGTKFLIELPLVQAKL